MPSIFFSKYRIDPARWPKWNYGWPAAYFITICTKKREQYFGQINGNYMLLSPLGELVAKEWMHTIELRKDMRLQLGTFVVMPNHLHGIIIVGDNEYNGLDAKHGVSTRNCFGPQRHNIPSVIRGFKSAVTTQAKKMGYSNFGWQERYHDHVIKSSSSYDTISFYIDQNPANWVTDCFH